jgi:hypothetical protein
MARIKTGVSKQTNRDNLEALNLYYVWRNQFGIGVKMDSEFAWVVSNGKFGVQPKYFGQNTTRAVSDAHAANLPKDIDTIKVALYVLKTNAKVGA